MKFNGGLLEPVVPAITVGPVEERRLRSVRSCVSLGGARGGRRRFKPVSS